jgi:hypothetical protein
LRAPENLQPRQARHADGASELARKRSAAGAEEVVYCFARN